jgi:type III restriction enzyme
MLFLVLLNIIWEILFEIKDEELEWQQIAIKSVVYIFDGNNKNTFENPCFEGIHSNSYSLSKVQLAENNKSVITENVMASNSIY